MKITALFILLSLPAFHTVADAAGHTKNKIFLDDSLLINHVLDGTVKEWPATKFTTDFQTGIEYAIDNDSKNIFLAVNVPNVRLQLKMMRTGMSTFIDLKGKKKEGRGIEFPVKNDNADAAFQGLNTAKSQDQNGQQKKPNLKAVRMMMALNLVELKLFGFDNNGTTDQQLLMPNSVNIVCAWDAGDTMHIEYKIPLALLGENTALDKKEISLGWTIHQFELPKREATAEAPDPQMQQGYGGGRNGGYSGRKGTGRAGDAMDDRQTMMGEQVIWTRYTIAIPPPRGF